MPRARTHASEANPPPLILASASPRRAELLRGAGFEFSVVISPAPEPSRKPAVIPTELWPMCLAFMKAEAVQHTINGQFPAGTRPLILAADTIVVNRDRKRGRDIILNKAASRSHARRMLLSLQGKTHRVITGIALACGQRVRLGSAEAICRVKSFTQSFLDSYLDSNLWRGKAGAYGIQDKHDPFVELVSGDITTVIGLPMGLVTSELASFTED